MKMECKEKIYLLFPKSGNGFALNPIDLDYFENCFVGRKMPMDWVAPPVEFYQKSRPAKDFVGWMLAAPVVSEKAKQTLEPYVSKDVQFLYMLTVKKTKLYAINITRVVDCLDLEKSDVRYYSHIEHEKVIRRINKYMFDYEKLANQKNLLIFKIPQTFSEVFVTSKFVDIVESNNLTGAGFGDPEKGLSYLFE